MILFLISGRHFGLICIRKSLLFYRIHIKKLNLSLKWTKRCLNFVTDTLTTSSYRMEGIISMQFGINGRLRGFLGLFSIDPYEQDLTCVFREIDGVTIQKSLLKWQVAKQSVTNKCQKLLFYDMGVFQILISQWIWFILHALKIKSSSIWWIK